MSIDQTIEQPIKNTGYLPDGEDLRRNVAQRRTRGTYLRWLLFSSLVIAIAALVLLIANIANESFGLVAYQSRVDPATLSDRPIDELAKPELIAILQKNLPGPVLRREQRAKPFDARDQAELRELIQTQVLQEEYVQTWTLSEALLDRAAIEAEVAEQYPNAELRFHSWINWNFLSTPMSTVPALAGVRTALLGSLYMILLTMLIAIPIGVGAAIYLEEYATDSTLNRIIQTNINNLAGVPSIIYGMLGLAIFVRTLERFTSGAAFGVVGVNGRTLLSAALTMALLILPLLIIASQEAIRAVPRSIRLASYGLGATKWQTIWYHVLPSAFPGILTGVILAISRAIGETAPLIVIGASTYIVADPSGPFSNFTALPIQIYNWTQQPQAQFKDIAAGAIIVLLLMLLSLNSIAVFLRNRYARAR
jgi:phosphate transport system permease protein